MGRAASRGRTGVQMAAMRKVESEGVETGLLLLPPLCDLRLSDRVAMDLRAAI